MWQLTCKQNLFGQSGAVGQGDVDVDNGLANEVDEVVDQELDNHGDLRIRVDPESALAEAVAQIGQKMDPGPAQEQGHEPGQDDDEGCPDDDELIGGAEVVSLVDGLDLQDGGDPGVVGSSDAAVVGGAVEGQNGAPDQPERREDD